jgi:hypothetical protein
MFKMLQNIIVVGCFARTSAVLDDPGKKTATATAMMLKPHWRWSEKEEDLRGATEVAAGAQATRATS